MLLERDRSAWKPVRLPQHHVRGALKLYSRECLAAIGGVRERLGWDRIDGTYARMHGFGTCSFEYLVARHHRPVGSADGRLRGRVRGGETHYAVGFHLPWALLKSIKIAASRPIGLSGAAFLYGYLRAAVTSAPRVEDKDYRRFMRLELSQRMRRRLGATAGS